MKDTFSSLQFSEARLCHFSAEAPEPAKVPDKPAEAPVVKDAVKEAEDRLAKARTDAAGKKPEELAVAVGKAPESAQPPEIKKAADELAKAETSKDPEVRENALTKFLASCTEFIATAVYGKDKNDLGRKLKEDKKSKNTSEEKKPEGPNPEKKEVEKPARRSPRDEVISNLRGKPQEGTSDDPLDRIDALSKGSEDKRAGLQKQIDNLEAKDKDGKNALDKMTPEERKAAEVTLNELKEEVARESEKLGVLKDIRKAINEVINAEDSKGFKVFRYVNAMKYNSIPSDAEVRARFFGQVLDVALNGSKPEDIRKLALDNNALFIREDSTIYKPGEGAKFRWPKL